MFRKIPFNVYILGLVSFFNDVASEMIYPLVPIFLTTVLHAPVSIVGLIEGIAEGLSSILKFVFGYLSDRMHKRKIFVVLGYTVAALSRPIIGLATIWPLVLFAQVLGKVGKGLRTSARDSLLLQNTKPHNKGFIFGFHRAMDSAGAVIGPLLALVFLTFFTENLRSIFYWAFFPGIIGVILLVIFVKEKKKDVEPHLPRSRWSLAMTIKSWQKTDKKLKLFFLISIIFALGNSSNVFLILRATDLGFTTTMAILAYVLYNLFYTIFSTPAGRLADKIGARRVYMAGLLVFAIVYLLLAKIHNPFWLWILFPIYGIYIAFTDGVSKAYIAEFITEKESGSFFGLYEMGTSLAIFFASFIGGLLWTMVGPASTFYYGAIMAIIAYITLLYAKIRMSL